MPTTWLGTDGWFAPDRSRALESSLIEAALADLGPAGEGIRGGLESVQAAAAADPAAGDRAWLTLCSNPAELTTRRREVRSLGLAAIEAEVLDAADRGDIALPGRLASIDGQLAQLKREALVLGNPLLSPGRVVFVKRFSYSPGWYYADFMRASRFGRGLYVLSLTDGQVTELVPTLSGGIFDRFDLAFDADRLVFGYKPGPGRGFRLWEAALDGSAPQPVTVDPADEAERIRRYCHPAYGPDGVHRWRGIYPPAERPLGQ